MVWSPPSVDERCPRSISADACSSIWRDRRARCRRECRRCRRRRPPAGSRRGHLQLRVVRPQQSRALPNVGRPESRPWPIADAGVERNADDRDVAALDVLDAGQPRECGQPGISRHDPTIDRSHRYAAAVFLVHLGHAHFRIVGVVASGQPITPYSEVMMTILPPSDRAHPGEHENTEPVGRSPCQLH